MDHEHTPKSQLELLCAKNIRETNAFFATLEDDEEEEKKAIKDLTNFINSLKKKKPKRRTKVTKPTKRDSLFKYTGAVPVERKRSNRLANKPPENYFDTEDTDKLLTPSKRRKKLVEELEQTESRPIRRKLNSSNWNKSPAIFMSADQVTEEYISNVAKNSSGKVYSQSGTSCHQCRQKTLDSKTFCRSGRCIGVRGQFCGPCLKNRYGEKVAVVLKDPMWACPPCRDLCNCSICRTRAGKRPTGILTPLALQEGYTNVNSFLHSLHGFGDFANKKEEPSDSEEDFLGFDNQSRPDSDKSKLTKNNNFESEGDCLGFDKNLKCIMTNC